MGIAVQPVASVAGRFGKEAGDEDRRPPALPPGHLRLDELRELRHPRVEAILGLLILLYQLLGGDRRVVHPLLGRPRCRTNKA